MVMGWLGILKVICSFRHMPFVFIGGAIFEFQLDQYFHSLEFVKSYTLCKFLSLIKNIELEDSRYGFFNDQHEEVLGSRR